MWLDVLTCERNIRAEADDLHSFGDVCAAGHDGFFFVAVFYPDLAVDAFAVPAEVAHRDLLDVEKLQAAEDRVVLRHAAHPAAYLNFDQPLVWLEHIVIGHKARSPRSKVQGPSVQSSKFKGIAFNFGLWALDFGLRSL
jgi:hypothetical protein